MKPTVLVVKISSSGTWKPVLAAQCTITSTCTARINQSYTRGPPDDTNISWVNQSAPSQLVPATGEQPVLGSLRVVMAATYQTRLLVQLLQHVRRNAQQRLVHVGLERYHVLPDERIKAGALLFPQQVEEVPRQNLSMACAASAHLACLLSCSVVVSQQMRLRQPRHST